MFRIPFERGVELAKLFNVDDLLQPLIDYIPPIGNAEKTPTKEQIRGSQKPTQTRRNSLLSNTSCAPEKKYKEVMADINENNCHVLGGEDFSHSGEHNEPLFSSHNFEFADSSNKFQYGGYYQADPFLYYCPAQSPPMQNAIALAAEPSAERHRACIMSWFYNSNNKGGYDMLYPHTMFPYDFDIDLVLDTQGHTALHWAAALGNIGLLNLLIQKGAKVDHVNNAGESALVRSVMVSYNHENQSFPDLLISLKDVIFIPDRKNRTLLHHICSSYNPKAKTQPCVYYMQCLLEYLANAQYDEQVSSQMIHSEIVFVGNALQNWINSVDVCGDTAVNIAARLGSKQLYDMLVLAGANVDIANSSGLKPIDFGFDAGRNNGDCRVF